MKTRYLVGGAMVLVGLAGILSQVFRNDPNTIIFGGALITLFAGALFTREEECG